MIKAIIILAIISLIIFTGFTILLVWFVQDYNEWHDSLNETTSETPDNKKKRHRI